MSDLLDFLDVSQRQATWRWEHLDQDLQNPTVIEVERSSIPTLSVNTSRAIKRTISNVDFPHSEQGHIDVLRDRLRLSMVLEDGSVWPQGVFLFADSTTIDLSSTVHNHPSHLADQTLIVDQGTDRSVDVKPGTTVTQAIEFLLFLMASTVKVEVEPSNDKITPEQEAVSWPMGTSLLRIINELCAMIGYHDLYFDNFGLGHVGPMPNPETVDEFDVLTYPIGRRTYRPSIARSNDALKLPNRFVVTNGGATDTPVRGVYDVPDDAPHSFANRGFRVTHVEQMQGVESNQQATKAARALARDWRFPFETVEFSGPPDPRHDTYNIVDLHSTRYLELGWTLPLVEGSEMRHELRRTYEGDDDA